MTVHNREEFRSSIVNLNIDVFLCSSSFEDRCFVIPEVLNSIKPTKTYIFYNENEVTEIVDNANELNNLKIGNSSLVELNSGDSVFNYFQMMRTIEDIVKGNTNRNILIDTTTFTHESLLILIRLIEINKDLLNNVFISYLGAKEYSVNETNDEEKWLSKGVDQIRTIIGYPGFSDPTRKNHLIILFGFELDRTQKIIDEYEFDYITLGFGDLPTQSNHMIINKKRHQKLLEAHPEANEFSFSLINPYETSSQLLDYLSSKSEFVDCNTVIAPLNNKISTIGAGLAAIKNEMIQLAYAKASLYNIYGYSIPNEDFYLCKLDLK